MTQGVPTAGTQLSEGAGRRSDASGLHGAELAPLGGLRLPLRPAFVLPVAAHQLPPNPWVSSGAPPPSGEGDTPSSLSGEKAARSKERRWLWLWARRSHRGLGALVHLVTPLDLSSFPTNGAMPSQGFSED